MLTQRLTFGSLFSGIGGLDLGLERAGLSCSWHVEAQEYCRQVLERHWPGVPQFEDVREVGAHNLPPVDVIVGGFPCQDVSSAGKKIGIEGARSGLWSEFFRIVCELRPRYVVVENVAALLYKGRGIYRVLSDLAEGGYDAQWDCVPASAVGAHHRRDRVFIVAYPSGERGRDGDHAQLFQRVHAEGVGHWPPTQSLATVEIEGRAYVDLPESVRVADGVPGWVDIAERRLAAARVKGCGNAVVPQVGEHVGRCLVRFHERPLGRAPGLLAA